MEDLSTYSQTSFMDKVMTYWTPIGFYVTTQGTFRQGGMAIIPITEKEAIELRQIDFLKAR